MQLPTSALVAGLFRETEIGRLIAEMNEHGAGARRLMDALSASPTACLMRELADRRQRLCAMTRAFEPENGK